MNPLYHKLKEMRERPGMYLGKKSLTLLEPYINGYLDGQTKIKGDYEHSFSNFGEYVRRHFDIHSNHGWLKIINFYSSSDEDAVDLFYKLLDKFLMETFNPHEEIYKYVSVQTQYENRAVKEIHYTDHGNPKRHSNPHTHKIKWLPSDSYYFDYLHGNLDEVSTIFEHKDGRASFGSVDEFANNLLRGGEIEFTFNDKKYSITHPEGKLCFIEIGNEDSETFFDSIEKLLNYEIDKQKILDIVTKIKPYFRCF